MRFYNRPRSRLDPLCSAPDRTRSQRCPLPLVGGRILSPFAISIGVATCIFGGALVGFGVRTFLPDHHLGSESKDLVKLGTGLIGTMAALVLGLMVASTKSA